MGIILRIGRKLPKPIKRPLGRLYNWWNFKLDKGIIRDFGEYFNLDKKEVVWLLKSAGRLNADLWRIFNPRTKKEIEKFYEITPFYTFALAFWHMQESQRQFRSEIVRLAKGKILDFGGGIGDLCIELSKKGFIVDYADVCGKTFKFAKWLFQKRNCNIEMIDLSKNKLSKEYDTILCIDVIEHVVNPKMVLKNLSNHLKNNGRLIITGLNLQEDSKAHPMHFKMDFDAEKYLNSLGVFKANKHWLWVKSQKT